jgi:hypothetical protein
MKVISFCLYGDNPLYTVGAVKNAKLVKELLPDWKSMFFCADNVREEVINDLKSHDAIIHMMDHNESFTGMFWRFLPISFPDVEIMMSRDCDSRIFERDVYAIREFESSPYHYSIIRDHPLGHHWRMNGGMWGAKKTDYIKNIDRYIQDFLRSRHSHIYNTPASKIDSIRNEDQIFLVSVIYPQVVNDALIHDEYFMYEPHVKKMGHDRKSCDFAFVGESIDENDQSRDAPLQRLPTVQRYAP